MALVDHVNEILAWQFQGWSAKRIAKLLGYGDDHVRTVAKEAGSPFGSLQAITGLHGSPPAALSFTFVDAFAAESIHGGCLYVEGPTEDAATRPCGEPRCIVFVGHRARLSRWCAEHHRVVHEDPSTYLRSPRVIIEGDSA